jgi:hypothetical protein
VQKQLLCQQQQCALLLLLLLLRLACLVLWHPALVPCDVCVHGCPGRTHAVGAGRAAAALSWAAVAAAGVPPAHASRRGSRHARAHLSS